jgi:hypothetical protein
MAQLAVGTVQRIKIVQVPTDPNLLDFAIFYVRDENTKMTEAFTLWVTRVGQCTPPSILLAHSLNISLLREALAKKLQVLIGADAETSANVSFVELFSS